MAPPLKEGEGCPGQWREKFTGQGTLSISWPNRAGPVGLNLPGDIQHPSRTATFDHGKNLFENHGKDSLRIMIQISFSARPWLVRSSDRAPATQSAMATHHAQSTGSKGAKKKG